MSNKTDLYINLWSKKSGHAFSHNKGLTAEQVAALKELKPGDRLVLFRNDKKGDNSPDYSLKKAVDMPKQDGNDSGGL